MNNFKRGASVCAEALKEDPLSLYALVHRGRVQLEPYSRGYVDGEGVLDYFQGDLDARAPWCLCKASFATPLSLHLVTLHSV